MKLYLDRSQSKININDENTEYMGGGRRCSIVMVRMGELMKGDQIRGWGLCFRSGAQIQVSGSGLKARLNG